MTTLLKRSAVLAAGFLVMVGGVAHADVEELIQATVPFPFVVNGHTLPAGRYMIERESTGSEVLMIRGEQGAHPLTAFVSTLPAGGHDPNGAAPTLAFTHGEHGYQLSAVWESHSDGQQLVVR